MIAGAARASLAGEEITVAGAPWDTMAPLLSAMIDPPGATDEIELPSGPTIVLLELGPWITCPVGMAERANGDTQPALAAAKAAKKTTAAWKNISLYSIKLQEN